MYTYVLYALAGIALIVSFVRDREKTKKALHSALRSIGSMLPQFYTILVLIAFFLTILDAEAVSKILGRESGALGLLIAGGIGSITLIPPYVALPLAASLLKSGAGYPQITIFISTLTMVGIVTLPVEIKYLGVKTALKRNGVSLIFAVVSALFLGMILV